MSRPAPPLLTIWHDGSERTFAPGQDVVIGRDLLADIRIADPRISRAHLILRFEQGKWVAIGNGSVNGTFVTHATLTLTPLGTEIRDASVNGACFVRWRIRLKR